MTTIAHSPVTDGPLVMRFEYPETGALQAFSAVQIRIQTAAACVPVDGTLVTTEDGPEYEFTLPVLPVRAYSATTHADDGDGFHPLGKFVLQIKGDC